MLGREIGAFRNASPRDLRKFGLAVGGAFWALGLWFLFRHKAYAWYVLGPSLALVLLGAVLPRSLKWVYVGWMALAVVLGTIVSTLLLTLLFHFVVTPIGWMARFAGKDFLQRKMNCSSSSYWIVRDTSGPNRKQEHEQQF